jgi:hypothetical protein
MSPAPLICVNHPARPAFAACMSCSKRLCQECATQWDGIWHCAACLGAQRSATVQRSPVPGWLAVIAGTLLILYASAQMMVWSSALLAGLL